MDMLLPKVSVIIAARDEEDGIACCLDSLLKQAGVAEIIVVDDQSSDRTGEIVKAFADRHSSLHLVTTKELPPGWTGKTHALHLGAASAQGDYLLFTDADVVFSGMVISEIARRMDDKRLDFIGGLFGIRCESVGEKVCAPVLATISWLALSLTAQRLGAGTGAFNMVRKSVYFAAGGHAAICSAIVDDVALARLIKSHGSATAFEPNPSSTVKPHLEG